jgi:hypothetical protein
MRSRWPSATRFHAATIGLIRPAFSILFVIKDKGYGE